eukprot:gnl/TRDRNA2_/TRDRNA2_191709_c0_seq1.p1 gnl/TRDRNA2_/TRDRNA2_191709_c0~~gnl/TRDRNA2_/TRDRNA2_191709_c0_seq1.p1  ORF type:complete len:190 (+),score=35.46 gnl/TRDRNA2_/TRDRNA2_191709_c0_seq1:35-604(+)
MWGPEDGPYILPAVEDDRLHYLEVEGQEPVAGVPADWSRFVIKGNLLCSSASVYFDQANPLARKVWGTDARGKIVVALRGEVEFDTMAYRAEKAGAVGLIVVDNEDVFEDDWEMTVEDPHKPAPKVPALLVPRRMQEVLCASDGALKASMYCRQPPHDDRISKDAEKLMFLRIRGATIGMKKPALIRST